MAWPKEQKIGSPGGRGEIMDGRKPFSGGKKWRVKGWTGEEDFFRHQKGDKMMYPLYVAKKMVRRRR